MTSRARLERVLADLEGFTAPRVGLEQYATPPDIAAHLVHLADLSGDLDRPVVDLGTGTGILALGAAIRGASTVIGLDRDPDALATARENARRLGRTADVAWVLGDGTRAPLCPEAATVIMNPPFGAQSGATHADRAFLATAAGIATVSYSIHNAGSRRFVEAFASDNGGSVTGAFRARIELDRQFDFHTEDRAGIDAEVYRISW